jgi:hypothetical protein
MAVGRRSQEEWRMLLARIFRMDHVSLLPHKIFRWDRDGIYRDCFFPVACPHFFGGDTVVGRPIADVLPKNVSRHLTKAVLRICDAQRPEDIQLLFSSLERPVVAAVRLVPHQKEVLGFVTDHYLDGRPVISLSWRDPSLEFLRNSDTISDFYQ